MGVRDGRGLRDGGHLQRLREQREQERLTGSLGSGGRPTRGRRGGPFALLGFGALMVVLAVVILIAGVTILRPVVRSAVVAWAGENASALRIPFVSDLVREDIGASLTDSASTDPTQVGFKVLPGDTATSIADRLQKDGLLVDARAFIFLAVEKGVDGKLEAGDYVLRRNMTPDQLVGSLLLAQDPAVTVTIREGLRIEQITAKLETLPLKMDPAAFYKLAMSPSPSLLAAEPWLQLPAGRSLEGFLYPDTYRVLPDTTPDEFLRMLLDRFHEVVGEARMNVPTSRGLDFYQVLSLASIVEQEAIVDAERPLIAGVYQNRLDRRMMLQADPTVIYGNDTVALSKMAIADWRTYSFWNTPDVPLAKVALPKRLAGYQTYANVGLIPGPISTPSLASIDAALNPDTSTGYLFFVAKKDGSNTHAFATTYAQHLANLKKYGYQ